METKAQLKFLHIAPRKARLVANVIKGMDAKHALVELNTKIKKSAKPIAKLLHSALANRKQLSRQEDGSVIIKNIAVNIGPVYKRHMPRAFGRASMIRKRTSHIQLILEDVPRSAQK